MFNSCSSSVVMATIILSLAGPTESDLIQDFKRINASLRSSIFKSTKKKKKKKNDPLGPLVSGYWNDFVFDIHKDTVR